MEEILHQLVWQISHYLQGFIHVGCLFGISEPSTVLYIDAFMVGIFQPVMLVEKKAQRTFTHQLSFSHPGPCGTHPDISEVSTTKRGSTVGAMAIHLLRAYIECLDVPGSDRIKGERISGL